MSFNAIGCFHLTLHLYDSSVLLDYVYYNTSNSPYTLQVDIRYGLPGENTAQQAHPVQGPNSRASLSEYHVHSFTQKAFCVPSSDQAMDMAPRAQRIPRCPEAPVWWLPLILTLTWLGVWASYPNMLGCLASSTDAQDGLERLMSPSPEASAQRGQCGSSCHKDKASSDPARPLPGTYPTGHVSMYRVALAYEYLLLLHLYYHTSSNNWNFHQ